MAHWPPSKKLKKPKRCPSCRSRRVVVAVYKDGSRSLECEGCWTVLQEQTA